MGVQDEDAVASAPLRYPHATRVSQSETVLMHYLLIYETIPDYVTRRAAFRELHLAHAQAAVHRGELVLGGASGDPVDSAIIVFRAASAEVPRSFAMADPYVVNGLVTKWYVKPWHTVVGQSATLATSVI